MTKPLFSPGETVVDIRYGVSAVILEEYIFYSSRDYWLADQEYWIKYSGQHEPPRRVVKEKWLRKETKND